MAKIRIAQYGTKHGHAGSKLQAMKVNPAVEMVGVFEPDTQRRAMLQGAESKYAQVHWFGDKREMLEDDTIAAIASEGRNTESLEQTEEIVAAGKHVWYDKPAGDNWEQWQRVVGMAEQKGLRIQMGYMFRYHPAFNQIATWVKSGLLGEVFSIRAHMSTNVPEDNRAVISAHEGGIFYDLGAHMLD